MVQRRTALILRDLEKEEALKIRNKIYAIRSMSALQGVGKKLCRGLRRKKQKGIIKDIYSSVSKHLALGV